MSELFGDRLLAAIKAKGSPICVGIDPILEMLPGAAGRATGDAETSIDAIFDFVTAVLKIVAPHVPCVKFQSAYFEKYLWEGVEAYYTLVQEAQSHGLLVIGDVKRGDIGSTSAAYAAGHLADQSFGEATDISVPDAITVNPFCGLDAIAPFLEAARQYGKWLFILVRTSNQGSVDLQDALLQDGRTWSEMLADRLCPLTEGQGLVGDSGYSSIGAVVGATQTHTMQSLRRRLPHSIFLLPGYGAQGATAEMTRAAFVDGQGAIVSASRSILYAHRNADYAGRFGTDWKRCVEQAVIDMKEAVKAVIGG